MAKAMRKIRKLAKPAAGLSARRKIAARVKSKSKSIKAKSAPRKQTFVASHHSPDAFE